MEWLFWKLNLSSNHWTNSNMTSLMDNQDSICYLVTKHSKWKGKYKRIFSFGTNGVSTYDPDNFELTNRWPYTDIHSIGTYTGENRFAINGKKEGANKVELMIFSTEHRSELLTIAYSYRQAFTKKYPSQWMYDSQKQHWSGMCLPVLLDVTPASINQVDPTSHTVLACYLYKDIEQIYFVTNLNNGFVIETKQFGRKHLFISSDRDEIIRKVLQHADDYMRIELKSSCQISIEDFLKAKFGKFSDDEQTTSLVEFSVEKVESRRHKKAVHRLLCLTQSCIVERDPETYNIVTLRPLESIFALIRDPVNPRKFIIEYKDMESSNTRTYDCANRDSILATLLDGVRGAGNKDVHVKMKLTCRGKRFCPFYSSSEEEVEAMHLRFLKNLAGKKGMTDMIERFNTNVPYSGLLHSVTQDGLFKENKEKPIIEALQAISSVKLTDIDCMCEEELEALYHLIRRLVASKTGFSCFTQIPGENLGSIVMSGMKKNSEAMTHAALDMICALMHPMHDDCDIKQEQLNKSSLLSNSNFLNGLLDKWTHHVNSDTGALIVCAMLDFLTFALCTPYSETTEGRHFDSLLEMVAKRGRSLFKHFQHPCTTIVKGASLVMRAIIEEGESEIAGRMKELALSEGALPLHLISSFFTSRSNEKEFTQCQLSRHLVSLWLTNNVNGMKLMERILPSGLLLYLHSSEKAPSIDDLGTNIRDNLKLAQDHASKSQTSPQLISIEKKIRFIEKHFEDVLVHWGTQLGFEKRSNKINSAPVVLRKSRQKVKSSLNWSLFYYNFNRDHSLPNLIWNHKTREELKAALEKEVRDFEKGREMSRGSLIAWNYDEFEVFYSSLKDQLCIDGYYIKILLDKPQDTESLKNIPDNFFYNLYHRFLLSNSSEVKSMCLHALSIVYSHFFDNIGYFPDTKYLIDMLQMTYDKTERDRLLIFLNMLTLNKDNVKDIIDSNGIPVLIELMSLAHLHNSRAVVPTQSNVIEFKSDKNKTEDIKEWHCSNFDEKEEFSFKEMRELFAKGVINKETKCWAQGMQGWMQMQHIPQLKWTLLARGNSLMHESDLAILILNMLITMAEYYPSRNDEGAIISPICKLKKILSNQVYLPHIVQLLLTFDPIIVEKVAILLCHIAEDNVHTSKLYMTGVFYFLLMYTGSNVLPIAKFLQMTHTKQAFRGEEAQSSELMQRSILGQLLPEAMVHYLENHGDVKFAQIFLGEFDTPEVIWNSEMRHMMIQKIAAHIADFTPRLWSNNKAIYQHAIIPAIRYPQLDNELFCNVFYLKHLCDTVKFPDWPINDPVTVLRDVLETWKMEVEKKPLAMSIDEAYQILEIPSTESPDETVVRKAYYKLAQKYHPDKNLHGREKFEDVNKAYDFLCSRKVWMETGININNIVLIIKTQSILFSRYSSVLQPYKYAGYQQLIKTIQLEIEEDNLFSKTNILLPSAVELIYHTVKCSYLNAEEFNRTNGFEIAASALSRCVSTLSKSSSENDVGPLVCFYCARIFMIASCFENCRTTFKRIPSLVPDLVRILHFKGLVKLCSAVVECISELCIDYEIKIKLVQFGVIWYIVPFLFLYDYTLDESGIESSQDCNQQQAWNELARLSCKACSRLVDCCGKIPQQEENVVQSVLSDLLTKYITDLMKEEDPNHVLKTLNSNCETPYFLWNNSTRAELLEYLESLKKVWQPDDFSNNISFEYESHKKELIIGDIFVRIYNEQPTYILKNPKAYLIDLLKFIKEWNILEDEKVIEALKSVYYVIHHNLGVEIQCIGSFEFLFELLQPKYLQEVQIRVLKIIALVTRNQECICSIASSNVMIYLLLVLYTLPNQRNISLDCLAGFVTSSKIVKELVARGGILYLLDILLNGNDSAIRIKTAEVLGRLIDDKISGPQIKIALNKVLPSIVCDLIRDTPQVVITLLETHQENPEIIWTEDDHKRLADHLADYASIQFEKQKKEPFIAVSMPDFKHLSFRYSKELVIGGVYVNLFNRNPDWNLHSPANFLIKLFDAFIEQISKSKSDDLEVIGTALCNLLYYRPRLIDQVPSTGHIPKLLSQWSVPNLVTSLFTFKVLNHLFTSEACVESVRLVDCVAPIKNAMAAHPEVIEIGCEVLCKLFDFNHELLIEQAMEANIIPFLLGLLEEVLPNVDNSARTKAIIAKTLKKMASSSIHGVTINSILDESPVWSAYSQQKLDLFITNSTSPAYLMGGPTASGGYLTQGPTQNLSDDPPPVNRNT